MTKMIKKEIFNGVENKLMVFMRISIMIRIVASNFWFEKKENAY